MESKLGGQAPQEPPRNQQEVTPFEVLKTQVYPVIN